VPPAPAANNASPAPAAPAAPEPKPAVSSAPAAPAAPAEPKPVNPTPITPAKEGEKAEADPKEAEPFKLTLPEGEHDQEAVGLLEGLVQEGGLSPELAQKLADQHVAALQRYEAWKVTTGQKQIDAWEGEIRSHPEFGGLNLSANVEAAKLMLQKYGSAKLVDDFRRLGVLSHPEFAYMLMRLSRELSDHASIGGESRPAAAHNVAKNLFPNFK
jgi:hypothetical protein